MIRALAVLLLLAWAGWAAAEPSFPPLTGRVVDAAGILSPADEQAIAARSEALERATGRQLVVATIPDLQGYDIADYGYQLGRAWGIGERGRDTGVLLIVAPAERRVRIEVGYGLEPVLTDALSRRIIEQAFRPYARAGDLAGAIRATTEAIAAQLQLSPAEAEARARAATGGEEEGVPLIAAVLMLAVAMLVLWLSSRSGGRAARGGMAGTSGPIIIWGPPPGPGWRTGWDDGGRSGGFGGRLGGGFGGGFSGGGGSFGGGGASGSW